MRARRRGARGAEMVELAIAFPLLALLVFGIIEFGFVFYNNISLNQGVREAARQAAVACYSGNTAACGTSADIGAYAKDRAGLKASDTYVAWSFPSPVVGQEFTVCAMYPRDSITGLLAPFINGYSKSKFTMRIEQIRTGIVPTTGGDAAPGGQAWDPECTA